MQTDTSLPVEGGSKTSTTTALDAAIERACASIAPSWPLDRFIAVNPLWGRVDAPIEQVGDTLASLWGARLTMPRSWYRAAWRAGLVREPHIEAAIEERGRETSPAELSRLLTLDEPTLPRRARVMDVLDAQRDLSRELAVRDFTVHALSQHCAAYFGEESTRLAADRSLGLYGSWRRAAAADLGPQLTLGLRGLRAAARTLAEPPRETIHQAMAQLDVAPREAEAYLTALLLDVHGWASCCAYRRWTARLSGAADTHLVELLAIRVAWEWMLLSTGGPSLAARWQHAMAAWPSIDAAARGARDGEWLLQRAHELAYREELLTKLRAATVARPSPAPRAQAVLCIDVRSEVFRRALEGVAPDVDTLGFAGFFGLPIEVSALGAETARPHLPGLLAPRARVSEQGEGPAAWHARHGQLERAKAWADLKTGPVSGLAYVESMGLAHALDLVREGLGVLRPRTREDAPLRLEVSANGAPLSLEARVELAAGMLRGMSLTRGHARLIALLGHRSSTTNNAHRAGLDCGACGGQSGAISARVAAALLRDADVRRGLAARGIELAPTTQVVAGAHDTTTDEVELFDTDQLPDSHAADLQALVRDLEVAALAARRERAERLGPSALEDSALRALDDSRLRAMAHERARDWAEVRPEWGLANNAAFIAAPRERTRDVDLGGRVFLHEYRWQSDTDSSVLTQIMTAPMLVAHWINFQYYASTVDNARFGSGDKLLHDVVGGHLGVFEGNGGDLRVGLPLQSLHDGERWVHTPLRLAVLIEAPRERIDAIVRGHAQVRSLVENGWIQLLRIDPDSGAISAFERGEWREQPR